MQNPDNVGKLFAYQPQVVDRSVNPSVEKTPLVLGFQTLFMKGSLAYLGNKRPIIIDSTFGTNKEGVSELNHT